MIGGQLIVDSAHGLPLGAVIGRGVRNLAARIGRGGQPLNEVQRGRTEPGGIDLVVHESPPQRDLAAAVARG